jgi:hypothetical protein
MGVARDAHLLTSAAAPTQLLSFSRSTKKERENEHHEVIVDDDDEEEGGEEDKQAEEEEEEADGGEEPASLFVIDTKGESPYVPSSREERSRPAGQPVQLN